MKDKVRLAEKLRKARLEVARIEALLAPGSDDSSDRAEDPPFLEESPDVQKFTEILLDTLDAGVVACDERGELVLFNRAALEWHGLEAIPLGRRDWARRYGLYEPDGVTPLAPERIALARAFNGEQVRDDLMVIRAQGRPPRQVSVNGAPIRDASGNLLGAVVIMHDITARTAMERELEASRAQLALAMDMAKLVSWERDLSTGLYAFDDQFYALYGTTSEREGGAVMSEDRYRDEFVHPDDREQMARVASIPTDASRENPSSYEHRVIRRDGAVRHVQVRFCTLKDASGRHVKRLGATQDITERKELEQRLVRTALRLQEAQRIAQVGDWDWDAETDKSTWSDNIFTIHGLDPGHAPSTEEIFALIHPEDRQGYLEVVERAVARGEAYETEVRVVKSGGAQAHLLIKGLPEFGPSGQVARMCGTIQDITARKQAEQAILESRAELKRFSEQVEEHLRKTRTVLDSILESMPSAIIALDSEGLVTHWNRFAQVLSGKPASQVLYRPLGEAFPALAPLASEVSLAMETALPRSVEKMAFEIAGEKRLVDIMVYPLLSETVEGAVLRLDDVTQRIRMEEMIVQNEKMLLVGGLAGGMAHEINNPLAGILQSAQNIRRRITPGLAANDASARAAGCGMENVQRYLENRQIPELLDAITKSGQRASAIVRNMLGFIRKSPSSHAPASLSDLVDRALELASTDFDLKKKFDFRRIEIVKEHAGDMPPVPCSALEIEQVVFNMLANAAHAVSNGFLEGSRPVIVLRVFRDGGMAVIEIEDNGPGMDEPVKKKIFEPFFTTKSLGQGTGLGLSVSYFIVTRNHGGSINVDSRPGSGTTFSIRLPLGPEQPA